MKIQREKLFAMFGLIDRLLQGKTSVKFYYLLLKNKKTLQAEVDLVRSTQQANPPEGHDEFNKRRIQLCEEYAKKDEETGKPKVINNQYDMTEESRETFEVKLAELKVEFKDVVNEMDRRQEELIKLLNEEAEVDLTVIPLSVIPDVLSGKELELLFDIVDGDK